MVNPRSARRHAHRRPAHRRLGAVLVAVAALSGPMAIAGCSDGGGKAAQQAENPASALATLKSTLDKASSVQVNLTSANLPSGAEGIVSGSGAGKHPPAFKGSFKIQVKGIQADAQITAVDGKVWAKLPLVPGTREINVKDYGLPDPASLMSPQDGITNLLTKTADPKKGDDVRKGSEILHKITGKIQGQVIHDLFTIGDQNGSFDVTYGYDDKNRLRSVDLTGPFFSGSTSTYSITLDKYDEPVDISKP